MEALAKTNQDNHRELLDLMSGIMGRRGGSLAARRASRRLLVHFGSARRIGDASLEEIRINGRISGRQAESLYCAIKLGRCLCAAPFQAGEQFSNSQELYHRYRSRFFSANREHFYSLHLNSKNRLIREVLVSIGSLSTSVVHPREVFAPAVRDSAAALIFFHNHPSGDPAPSREDDDCTQRLVHAGEILGIRVLDHIVFGRNGYYSFSDSGRLKGS